MPTRVIMSDGCIAANGGLMRSLGKKALIVTGRSSARVNGAYADVVDALTANGQDFALYDKVMSNPTVACAYAGAAVAVSEKCDFVIAIGGGSPMDAAKGIAVLAVNKVAPSDIFSVNVINALPIAAVPTTAGTGSEVTQYAILTNDAACTKTSISSPELFPRIAFLDAKYTKSLGKDVAINTAVDALSHAVEGMLSARSSPISDALALDGIELISECFEALESGTLTDSVREKLLLASTLAGMVIANTGTTAVHAMGYSLTYFHDIDHGRANGLTLGYFLEFVSKTEPGLVENILRAMNKKTVADFQKALDMLLGKHEKITAVQIGTYAEKAFNTKNIGNCKVKPSKEELIIILTKAVG
jgi:alcohol dehydrogenase class IV